MGHWAQPNPWGAAAQSHTDVRLLYKPALNQEEKTLLKWIEQ